MMRVIVNWGGKIAFNLERIYNLTQMMRSNGLEVSLIEKDSQRQLWLMEQLGENVTIRPAQNSNAGHCLG